MDLFKLFIAGGPVMGLMLLGSLATAAIMIDRFLFYRHADKGMNRFIEKLPSLMEKASWQEMHVAVSQEENAAAYAAGEGIRAMMEGKDAELSLEVAYQTVAALLRARLNYLSMLVTLSPLLGQNSPIGTSTAEKCLMPSPIMVGAVASAVKSMPCSFPRSRSTRAGARRRRCWTPAVARRGFPSMPGGRAGASGASPCAAWRTPARRRPPRLPIPTA